MGFDAEYSRLAPDRKDIDALKEAMVLEFGTGWCGYCRGAQPLIAEAFSAFPQVRHLKIEDGPGRPLGRSFRVKLWPTLVFLREGVEVARIVRPGSVAEIAEALRKLESPPPVDQGSRGA